MSTPGRANAAPPSGPRLRARGTPLAQHIASWPSLISLPRTTGRPLLLSFQSDSLAAHSVFVCSAPILSYKLMPVRLSTYIICMVKYGATIVHVKPIYIFANESLCLCLCLCLCLSLSLSLSHSRKQNDRKGQCLSFCNLGECFVFNLALKVCMGRSLMNYAWSWLAGRVRGMRRVSR